MWRSRTAALTSASWTARLDRERSYKCSVGVNLSMLFACFHRLCIRVFLSLSLLQDTLTPRLSWADRESRMFSFSFRVYCWFLASPFLWFSFTALVRATTFPQTDLCTFSCKVSIVIFHCVFRRRKKKPFMKSLRMITYMRWVLWFIFLVSSVIVLLYGWLSFSSELCSYCCMPLPEVKARMVCCDRQVHEFYTCDFY